MLPENGTSLNKVEPKPRKSPLKPSYFRTCRNASEISENKAFKLLLTIKSTSFTLAFS